MDLSAVVGLVAANAGEASETVVQGARAHRDGRLSFGSKRAVEVDDGFHRRCPWVKGWTAEGFTMNPRLVEPGFVVVCLHADVPARPGKDENGEDDAQSTTTWEETGYPDDQALRKGDGSRVPAAVA